jgi:hypothetical protein
MHYMGDEMTDGQALGTKVFARGFSDNPSF